MLSRPSAKHDTIHASDAKPIKWQLFTVVYVHAELSVPSQCSARHCNSSSTTSFENGSFILLWVPNSPKDLPLFVLGCLLFETASSPNLVEHPASANLMIESFLASPANMLRKPKAANFQVPRQCF